VRHELSESRAHVKHNLGFRASQSFRFEKGSRRGVRKSSVWQAASATICLRCGALLITVVLKRACAASAFGKPRMTRADAGVFVFRTYLARAGLHLASGRPLRSIPPSAYLRTMSKSDAGSTSSKLTTMSVLSKLSTAALEAELERRKAAKGGPRSPRRHRMIPRSRRPKPCKARSPSAPTAMVIAA